MQTLKKSSITNNLPGSYRLFFCSLWRTASFRYRDLDYDLFCYDFHAYTNIFFTE